MHSTVSRMTPSPEKISSITPPGGSSSGMKVMASSESTPSFAC